MTTYRNAAVSVSEKMRAAIVLEDLAMRLLALSSMYGNGVVEHVCTTLSYNKGEASRALATAMRLAADGED